MDELKREELYKGLIEVFGAGHQMDVAVEEMAELTNALMKYKQLRATKEEVVTEIADVIVCMEQMSRYFGIGAVVAEKERKLKRQTERLKRPCAQIEAKEGSAGDDPGPLGEPVHIETDVDGDADEKTE